MADGGRDRNDVIALREAASAALRDGRDEEARSAFRESDELAGEVLSAGDPDRIAVAGAHAQAWFDWNDAERALEIAGAAYEAAVEDIDGTIHGERRRDAVRELGALRDQMTFWAFTMVAR